MFKSVQHKTINLEEMEGILIFIKQKETWEQGERNYYVFNDEAFCEMLDNESHDGWSFAGIVKSVSENCYPSHFTPNLIIPHTILLKRELLPAYPYRE